jgi:hypothetical protein
VTQGYHVVAHELRPELPAGLEAVIERAMSVQPKDRFSSVHALGRALFPFASAEAQRRFDDYYHSDPDAQWPVGARWAGTHEARPAPTPTLRQPDEPLATWQTKTTRTSERLRRASGPKPAVAAATEPVGPIPGAGRSRSLPRAANPLYSVAVGAVLAALALGILLLVLGP